VVESRFGRTPQVRDDAKRDRGDAERHQSAGEALERFDLGRNHDEPQEETEAEGQQGHFGITHPAFPIGR
jgi:hypothetical protein